MKKAVCITALLGIMMLPCAIFAQTTPTQTPAVPEATASTVPADQQPTKEQLNKLFELMNVRGQLASLSKMMPGLLQQQMQQMQKDHPEMATMSDEQQKEADKIMNKFMGRVFDVYNADDMIADMASIYQRHLTRSDVDGIIAFYSSPAGQHMIAMVPVVMQEYMPLAMQRMQDRMKPLIDEMGKEMEAIGKPAASSGTTPAAK
jgi:hypothetical protein